MSPRHPNDLPSRARRIQMRHLAKAEAFLRASLHLHGVDEAAKPHMERALAHIREAGMALQKVAHARSVSELVRDCETSEQFTQSIREFCAERDRGHQITP